MRFNYLVACISCALLGLFRLSDGSTAPAAAFGVLALFFLYLAVRPLLPATLRLGATEPSRGAGSRDEHKAQSLPSSGTADMEAIREAVQKRTKGWLAIIAFGCSVTVVGFFLFPPMSLLVAGMTVYALTQYRKYRRMSEQLTKPAR